MDSAVVFEMIKEMSKKTYNSQHRTLLIDIASALTLPNDELLLLITELESAGLIKLHRTIIIFVTLTNYGLSQ